MSRATIQQVRLFGAVEGTPRVQGWVSIGEAAHRPHIYDGGGMTKWL